METQSVPTSGSPVPELPRPAKRVHFPNLASWLVGGFVLLVLAGLILPVFNCNCIKGPETRALAQSKQVGLALKLFASDHDGNYPRLGVPTEMGDAPKDSNVAFACLFPTYTQSEVIFGNKLSAYETAPPDNVIDNSYTGTPRETLQPGENVYSYVMGLTDADDPRTPLVADGTDGTGHYNTERKKRGGVWEGKRAIVIRLDNSGAIETLAGPDKSRFVPKPGHLASNLFDFSTFGKEVRLLDPAVGPRRR